MGENILVTKFQRMMAPSVSENRFLDSIIDCRRPGQLFSIFDFDSIIVTTLKFTVKIAYVVFILAAQYSVSPSPKKGHGKVAKKGHFLHAATCQKGTFSAQRQAKGLFFKVAHGMLGGHILSTVIRLTHHIFSVISNLLFSLCSFLNFHISGFTFTRDNLENFFSLCLTLL